MSIKIERAILHALEPSSGMPVLSENEMELDEAAREFLEAHLENCMESDRAQPAVLREDSGFYQRIERLADEESFIVESRSLAEQFYQIISGNPSIPAGDLICLIAIDGAGKRYFAGLKMNYHDGFSHYYMNGCLSIVGQRAMLPGTGRKLTEAFVVDLEDFSVRVIEKTYLMMDESREAYLSGRILGCVPEVSERSKLLAVKKAVQKANKEVLGDQKLVEQELLSRIHGYLNEEEAPTVAQLCQEVFRDYPQIEPMVEERLASDLIDPEATVQVQPQTLKQFEKQSVKTPEGIEVKIPAELYRDQRAMEFIQNPDGTISLLIKNILV